ncbi:uncharacterized protein LOC134669951 [Cydia fagiglandana]|uniref:uncharacterized protein LOC134669951 n=1 Tax=Cydia fagiglandana TaxID=1458189 RepID=UPI002FEE0129
MDKKRQITRKTTRTQALTIADVPSSATNSDEEGLQDQNKYLKQINDKDKIILSLKTENKTTKELYKNLQLKYEENEQKYVKLSEENESLKHLVKEKEEACNQLKIQIDRLIHDNNDLTQHISTVETDNIEILTPLKCKILKDEQLNRNLATKIEELEEENSELISEINRMREATGNQDTINSPAEIKILEDCNKDLNIKVNKLICRLRNITNNYKKLKTNFNLLKKKSNGILPVQRSLKTMQKKIQDIADTLANKTTNEEDQLKANPGPSICTSDTVQCERNNLEDQEKKTKPKLLIVSDLHGTELSFILSKIRRKDYDICTDVVYLGSTERVLMNIGQKAMHFTKKDSVVIMTGGCDFYAHTPSEVVTYIDDAVKTIVNCNVIVCTIPNCINDYNFNQFINHINNGLRNLPCKYNNVVISCIGDNLTDRDYKDGYKLNPRGKFKLAMSINDTLRLINEKFYNSLAFL